MIKKGIVAIWEFNKMEDFVRDFSELEENPDFTLFGQYKTLEDANDELEYQGFRPEEIAQLSINRYGNVIETLLAPYSQTYYVFVGAR